MAPYVISRVPITGILKQAKQNMATDTLPVATFKPKIARGRLVRANLFVMVIADSNTDDPANHNSSRQCR